MPAQGVFEKTIVTGAWFDATALPAGWFDASLIGTSEAGISAKVAWTQFEVPFGGTSPQEYTASITEGVSPSTLVLAALATYGAVTESATLSAAQTVATALSSTVVENAGATDLADAVGDNTRGVVEAVTAGEVQSTTLAAVASVTEPVSASDSRQAAAALNALIAENTAVSDSQAATNQLVAAIIQAVVAIESADSSSDNSRSILEAAAAADSSVAQAQYLSAIVEGAAATDTRSGSLTTAASILEPTLAADTHDGTITSHGYTASIDESAALAESSTRTLAANALQAETVTALATAVADSSGGSSVSEAILASDAAIFAWGTTAGIAEQVVPAALSSAALEIIGTVAEPVGANAVQGSAASTTKGVVEVVTLTHTDLTLLAMQIMHAEDAAANDVSWIMPTAMDTDPRFIGHARTRTPTGKASAQPKGRAINRHYTGKASAQPKGRAINRHYTRKAL